MNHDLTSPLVPLIPVPATPSPVSSYPGAVYNIRQSPVNMNAVSLYSPTVSNAMISNSHLIHTQFQQQHQQGVGSVMGSDCMIPVFFAPQYHIPSTPLTMEGTGGGNGGGGGGASSSLLSATTVNTTSSWTLAHSNSVSTGQFLYPQATPPPTSSRAMIPVYQLLNTPQQQQHQQQQLQPQSMHTSSNTFGVFGGTNRTVPSPVTTRALMLHYHPTTILPAQAPIPITSPPEPTTVFPPTSSNHQSATTTPLTDPRKFKTLLCQQYLLTKPPSCKYGDTCVFAHGEKELRPIQKEKRQGSKGQKKHQQPRVLD